ncbi:hypothetical protein [uncultured Rubinisphaera sp.]|uniref:hypothetical protein n=1 Tax=uncultured Rubinisphaera sp. TaxID=1678686 RepID=UPI0030DB8921
MHSPTNSVAFSLCTMILFLSLGCGTSGEPEILLVPVTGTVTASGKPVVKAMVTFYPSGETVGKPSYGVTDETGHYELNFVDDRTGCPPGNHLVTISKFAQPDGSPFPKEMAPEMQTATGVEHIPAQFSSSQKTKLKAEVSTEGGQFPFEITLK